MQLGRHLCLHKAHAEQLGSAELSAGARGSPEAGPGWFPVALVPAASNASLTRPLPRSKTCPGAGLAAPGGREGSGPALTLSPQEEPRGAGTEGSRECSSWAADSAAISGQE